MSKKLKIGLTVVTVWDHAGEWGKGWSHTGQLFLLFFIYQ
jgi:hypothetical protein